MIGVMAGLVGLVLVIAAVIFLFSRSKRRAQRVKLIRGITLLDRLDDAACDYFYNKKKGALPDEVWAPFIAEADKHGDLVDAVITEARGAEDKFIDAARYKKGMKWTFTVAGLGSLYGPPGTKGPEPWRAQVQVIPGYVQIEGVRANVLFFIRHILVKGNDTSGWYGKATIILLRDKPSPPPETSDAPLVKELPPPAGDKKPSEAGAKPAEGAPAPAPKANSG
jgi:hypothetical protein